MKEKCKMPDREIPDPGEVSQDAIACIVAEVLIGCAEAHPSPQT